MTRPPDENDGSLVMTGEAEGGRGFLRTGVGTLTRDVWAWNAENEGTSMDGVAKGLERAEEGA